MCIEQTIHLAENMENSDPRAAYLEA